MSAPKSNTGQGCMVLLILVAVLVVIVVWRFGGDY